MFLSSFKLLEMLTSAISMEKTSLTVHGFRQHYHSLPIGVQLSDNENKYWCKSFKAHPSASGSLAVLVLSSLAHLSLGPAQDRKMQEVSVVDSVPNIVWVLIDIHLACL